MQIKRDDAFNSLIDDFEKQSIGQVVRFNTVRKLFKCAHHNQNTVEVFRVVKVNISHISVTHNISELDYDIEIEGIFFIKKG